MSKLTETAWEKIAPTEADWQKKARTEADWQKTARTDAMELWLGDQQPPITESGIVLGVHRYQGTELKLSDEHRPQHVYIVGTSGSGKSTLMLHMMKQDMEQGRGFAVIDPHGKLVHDILPHVPQNRIADTIHFNPADHRNQISLNPLTARTAQEREIVTANFMVLFTRLFAVKEAPRLLHILRHAVATLLESGDRTFLDIRTLLMNSDFRAELLAHVHNPYLLEFWEDEFPKLPRGALDPIINKLGQFRLSSVIHNVLGQPHSSIDFAELMNTRKLFFANLSEGEIQEENTMLLGSIITSMIQLAIMSRAKLSPEAHAPFTVYVDEFQNFTTRDSSAFQKILSEARKYNLSLVLAHQFTSQLPAGMRSAILGIVHTMVVFSMGIEDARVLQNAFTPDKDVTGRIAEKIIEKLQNLSRGEAIVRFGRADNTFPIRTYPPPAIPSPHFVREVIEHSQTFYGNTRAENPTPAAENFQEATPHAGERGASGAGESVSDPEAPYIDPWQ